MRKYIAVLAVCLVAVAMLAGCQGKNDSSPATEAVQQENAGVVATEPMDVPEVPEASETVYTGSIEIGTKFGSLYYQDQWEDYMRIELIEEDARTVVTFAADIEGVRYLLFRLVLGQGEGEPVCQITDHQGTKHDVFVYMEELSVTADLTEGEQNRLFAMQEEINYVIENLE